MRTDELFTQHLAPGLGCVVAAIMYFSPMKAVWNARGKVQLGELNPIPFAAIVANCTMWICYALVLKDAYVWAANQPGFLGGIFMTLTCYGLTDSQKVRDVLVTILMVTGAVATVLGLLTVLAIHDHSIQKTVWGSVAVTVTVLFYAAPLSVVQKVLRERCSASLYWPMSLMNTINGALWFIYGLAVKNPFIYGPNGAGVLLGLLQFLLIWTFPARPKGDTYQESPSEPSIAPTPSRNLALLEPSTI